MGCFWAESQADRVFSRLLFPQLYKRLFSCWAFSSPMYSAYSPVTTFISTLHQKWAGSAEVVALLGSVLLWERFRECKNILDSIASIWDVPEGKEKKEKRRVMYVVHVYMCVFTVNSKWWNMFSWVGYCSGTAGGPLKVPIKTGIRVIGRAELWTFAVILCCSSIQKSQLQITLHKEKASPWPQRMTQVQQAICERKEQRGSQMSNIT